MTTMNRSKPKFEDWQNYVNQGVNNAKWNVYDCEIQRAVDEFNRHLRDVAGYRPLDWQLIKAMTWVETGAKDEEWQTNPMQIGNDGDPGLRSLLIGNEGGNLILPPAWRGKLTYGTATNFVPHNIRAGIGYLLMRMANFAIKNVPDADTRTYELTVKAGDNFDKIARTQGTTIESLKQLNPGAHMLRPGQVLRYRKAAMRKVIVGWKFIAPSSIAFYYNGGGDALYGKKLDYAFTLVRNGKAALCTQ
ncbi:LysM peptidoglycan-binding domain-containing protein [Paraherbaspirillum soli]|uniref:LysM peptidoglycan-binding domain-containing protein n=1 Tax=Paraherbaspirillum soli TaxID=631222 RepID=A0ABW0MAW1_9BURK